jgi:hypothetical protein
MNRSPEKRSASGAFRLQAVQHVQAHIPDALRFSGLRVTARKPLCARQGLRIEGLRDMGA